MIPVKMSCASKTIITLAVCVLSLAVIGCDQTEETKQAINKRADEAQRSLDDAQKIPHPLPYDPLTVTDKVWNGNAALRMQRGMPLPARYEDARGVTLVSAEPMSLSEIANAISAQTGIPMRLSALTIADKPAAALNVGQNSSNQDMPISYEGPLSGLLERLSAFFGVSWRFDGSSITISRYETRVFVVEALPGTQQTNEGMQDDTSSSNGSSGGSSGGSGSSGSSGGGSSGSGSSSGSTNTMTQNSKITIDFKYWDELTAVLKSIVGSQGSAVVSPTMGTVTVTTTPDVMATVSDYLAKENKRLSHQIAITVQIYSVNLNQSEDYQIAFSAFINNLSKLHLPNLNYNTAAAPGFTNSNLSASSAVVTPLGSLNVAILNGQNSTASDIFDALSTIGNTSEVAQFPMTTLNNHPVSRRVGTDTSYIATVTNTSTSTTTTPQNTYTPVVSTIHDGFSLQLTPRLLDDGRILLQYSLSLIGLDSLGATTFNTGSGTIPLDLPVTDNRIFVQQSMLRSGQTLMIGGVDQEKLSQNQQGVGAPDNYLLGGGTSSDNNHLMLFMAITPQVMDIANEEHD